MKETLVVIPYLAKEAQGNELELAVRGWTKHFKSPHKIVVIGDYLPGWEGMPDVYNFSCPQVPPVAGQYLPHLDMVNKFRHAHYLFPKAKNFIYACDDMYAVRDFTLKDVMAPKISDEDMPIENWEKEKGWWRDLGKTRALCIAQGWPTMNWVCHLPVYYDFERLLYMYDLFRAEKFSYVWENIYFNCLEVQKPQHPVIVPSQGSRYKYEVTTSNPDIRKAEDAKAIWITNATCGWSETLERILMEHYESK